jgi:hypothetical protein
MKVIGETTAKCGIHGKVTALATCNKKGTCNDKQPCIGRKDKIDKCSNFNLICSICMKPVET